MTQEELIEKVARASYDEWRRVRRAAPPFEELRGYALESEFQCARAAISIALEEAAKVADAVNTRDVCVAAALRALIPSEVPPASS